MTENKKSCTFMQDSKPYFTKTNYAPVDGLRPSLFDLLILAPVAGLRPSRFALLKVPIDILILIDIINC